MKKYRLKPGEKVRLSQHDASDKSYFDTDKEGSLEILTDLRLQLRALQTQLYAEHKHKILVVLQAMDSGGKDGTIRHVLRSVDPQGIDVAAFKAPSSHELDHDYLWRVHQRVPGKGHITVFNRSHYEDIVAVRVKNLAPAAVWKKRYKHIVNFEQMLIDEGTSVIKLFLNISKDEQKERLEARLADQAKHWKFNPDDLKDRKRWGDFIDAYEDILERTSTEDAPWHIIPANRKWYRNLVVAKTLVDTLKGLGMEYPHVDFDPKSVKIT